MTKEWIEKYHLKNCCGSVNNYRLTTNKIVMDICAVCLNVCLIYGGRWYRINAVK